MTYEILTKNHLEEIVEIYIKAFNAPPWNDKWTKETATKRLSQILSHEGSYGLIAYKEEKAVAMILGWEEQFYDKVMFEIKEFCTDPAVSGSGIGTKLLKEFEFHLKEKGIDQIILLTCKSEVTQGYYTKRQYKDCEEMILMEKELR